MTATATFAAALADWRQRRGLTQAALAEAAGLHPNTIARMERGEIEPSWPAVCRLADALGISVTSFRKGKT